jgi:hypothetical protein
MRGAEGQPDIRPAASRECILVKGHPQLGIVRLPHIAPSLDAMAKQERHRLSFLHLNFAERSGDLEANAGWILVETFSLSGTCHLRGTDKYDRPVFALKPQARV